VPGDDTSKFESGRPVTIRLLVPEDELGPIGDRLAKGVLAVETDVPFPPDTRVSFELCGDKGRVVHCGEGRVDSWRTLPKALETGEPPGMWIRVDRLDGAAVTPASDEPFEGDLRDVSESVAAQIDLDAADASRDPVPLPGPRPGGPPDVQFVDLSELRAAQFDLDVDAPPPAPPRASPAEFEEEQLPVTQRALPRLRQDARATSEFQVRARLLPSGRPFSASVWNLSSSGMFLRTTEPLEQGGMLLLETRLPGQDQPLRFQAAVVWIQAAFDPDQPPRVPGVGIRFVSLAPAVGEKIRRHVEYSQIGAGDLEPVEPAEVPRPAPAADEVEGAGPAAALGAWPQEAGPEPGAAAPGLPAQSTRRMVVDALMTSLDLSGVESFRDNDTIRYLLECWFLRYYDRGVVDLTLLWNTLAAEPTVSAVQAALPLFIFALARSEHGLPVRLPEGLRRFDAAEETLAQARRCLAGVGTFRVAYERVARQASEAARLALESDRGTRPARPAARPAGRAQPARVAGAPRGRSLAPWPRTPGRASRGVQAEARRGGRRLVIGLCVLLAFAALLWLALPRRARYFNPAGLDGVLKLEEAFARDGRLQATIRDPRWNRLGTEQRRDVLRELLARLEQQGIESALLFDARHRVAAVGRCALEPGAAPLLQIGAETFAGIEAGAVP